MAFTGSENDTKPSRKRRASTPPELLPLSHATFCVQNHQGDVIGRGPLTSLLQDKDSFEGLRSLQDAFRTVQISLLFDKFRARPGIRATDDIYCIEPEELLLRDDDDLAETIRRGLEAHSEGFVFRAHPAQDVLLSTFPSTKHMAIRTSVLPSGIDYSVPHLPAPGSVHDSSAQEEGDRVSGNDSRDSCHDDAASVIVCDTPGRISL